MAKSILKKTETLAIIKISGTGATETATLGTDLLAATEVVSGTPTVNIAFAQWNVSSGASDTITVTRGGTPVLNLYQNAGELDMSGNGGGMLKPGFVFIVHIERHDVAAQGTSCGPGDGFQRFIQGRQGGHIRQNSGRLPNFAQLLHQTGVVQG